MHTNTNREIVLASEVIDSGAGPIELAVMAEVALSEDRTRAAEIEMALTHHGHQHNSFML
jgi:hypothetical protein